MLILKQLDQVHAVEVAGQEITFTVRPAQLMDLDLAYMSSRADDPQLAAAEDDTRENIANLRAGRAMILQRIVAWKGVYLSETEPAPCETQYLSAFFGQFPGAFMELSDKVRRADEDAGKN